ncbi:MAG: hypothetical protein ABIO92_06915, partial [Chloroflexia bacterium]
DAPLRTRLASPWGLAGLYALMGGASMLLQAGYEGANYNHLLDGLVPACMLAGLTAGTLARNYELRITNWIRLPARRGSPPSCSQDWR